MSSFPTLIFSDSDFFDLDFLVCSKEAAHKSNEDSKKREYRDRVEHGTFTPLVFSCLGGISPEYAHYYNRLADKVSKKRNIDISKGRTWIRNKLCFSLLRSAHHCIPGSRWRKPFAQESPAETDIVRAMVDSKLHNYEGEEGNGKGRGVLVNGGHK